jgi:peroxiredoxin
MKNLNIYTLLILGIFFLHSNSNAQYIKRKAQKLPEMKYYTLETELFTNSDLKSDGDLIILYLNPSCELCHKEMKQILDNMDYLKETEIVIISPSSREDLQDFAKLYELAKYSQIKVLHDPRDFFYRQFKVEGYPSLHIYNSKKELVSEFESFTDFSEIMDGFAVAGK